jgi:hypothetical protein
VTNNSRAFDAQLRQGAQQEGCLFERSPRATARPLAVAEAGSVEGDEPAAGGCAFNDSAGEEIFDHAAVAMQQDDGLSGANVEVAQSRPVHCHEMKNWRPILNLKCRAAHRTHGPSPGVTRAIIFE